MILLIKHIDVEGPGTIGFYLKKNNIKFKVVDMSLEDSLPRDVESYEAVISLGGPMNVYEEDKYPFLIQEDLFIKEILKREIPFLGICLGSQLLAKAAGAEVVKSPSKEIGFYDIKVVHGGGKDCLFNGLPDKINVFHWHEDMFIIPKNGVLLAESKGCPNQAFKIGKNAYGLQFHVEITDGSICEWTDKYIENPTMKAEMKASLLKEYQRRKKMFTQISENFCHNFFEKVCQCG
ncbi:MAG: type 1 glutamine amidotransferase [Candidatus Omnitrophica bacterium]|nr:type 1 glutamine amidotransferase [Candidatus Omnitrophota bacterium]MCB9747140.1 type 1 glutamine amidotransferase [Candidatus Omnitrophota bacterium]